MKISKRKLLSIAAILTALVMGLSGCLTDKKEDKSLYEQILDSLSTLETYQADTTVRYISNNNVHSYRTNQYGKSSGEYRIEVTGPDEVAGSTTIFDGEVICQFNENVTDKIAVGTNESAERLEILLTSFIKNYFSTQEASVAVSNIGSKEDVTTLETDVPGSNSYFHTERLWIDNKTLKPIQLVVYDEEQNETIVVTYHEVEYNVELDDELFITKK